MSQKGQKDYSKLKELLDKQEKFPHDYPVKFIGKNTRAFDDGVVNLKKEFPKLREKSRRESQGGAHIALTFNLLADTSDEIILMLDSVSEIPDLLVIL